jgi:hypothetical protein
LSEPNGSKIFSNLIRVRECNFDLSLPFLKYFKSTTLSNDCTEVRIYHFDLNLVVRYKHLELFNFL